MEDDYPSPSSTRSNSAFSKWQNNQRRSSTKKREEEERITTPVRKARKESSVFLKRDGSNDTIKSDYEQKTTSKSKKSTPVVTNTAKLSVRQWNILLAFWEHDIFVRARYGGVFLSFMAAICGIISLVNADWVRYSGE